jgi:uncharacterized 2Fe-2S/4Fe-4S cluster protein (DUF4445 family)
MTHYKVVFSPEQRETVVPAGTLIVEAAQQAGLDIHVPCGGQGRCGRCAVIVDRGQVRRRSTVRLAPADLARGYALACQTVIEGDAAITLLPQEKVERRLVTDRTAVDGQLPFPYDPARDQTVAAFRVTLDPPSLADQTDDWARLQRALRRRYGIDNLTVDLATLRKLGAALREGDWTVTAVVELDAWNRPDGPPRLIDLLLGDQTGTLLGAALDIGTTSNVLSLVDLLTGKVLARAADYNGQITRGEDVIARMIYAGKPAPANGAGSSGLEELQQLVLATFNRLLEQATARARVDANRIYKATVVGNSTMIHLFLGLPPQSIRLAPFITAINQPPPVLAGALGLHIHPQAAIDCLPGVASYVGADISAGVVSSGLMACDQLTLFLDVGTNGEMVLGARDWLATCACSAGPAFEGAGVEHGMRATAGAIEEVWVNSQSHEPTWRVIGGGAPTGICGSGLIALLAELFITGVVDRSGKLKTGARGEGRGASKGSSRVREGAHGLEYVVARAAETATGADIVLTQVDIDNLLRAKAAIYAGYTVLCQSVGVDPGDLEQVLIGGAFGQYINIEKAIQIGLLPDLPWERFQFLGNTAVKGAYYALLSRTARDQVTAAAAMMTYLELSADNTFYDNFMSALFLPHTALDRFPSVQALLHPTG